MKVGEVFRYASSKSPTPVTVDGVPNYFAATHSVGQATQPLLFSGINEIGMTAAVDGPRRPAILNASSPHKRGSRETPWHDTFDPDNGVVLYYGDNKSSATPPESSRGNAELLKQFRYHTSPDPAKRAQAAPLILWERVSRAGRKKGYVAFQGLGILTNAELVTQYNPKTHEYFANYRWEIAVLTLKRDGENFSWDWVSARRDPHMTLPETQRRAPHAWRQWQAKGPSALEGLRRHVVRFPIVDEDDQVPGDHSAERAILQAVYARYATSKDKFENLASFVAASYLRRNGVRYTEGWVTPKSSDGGIDFVGRIDLGVGFGSCRLVVLGQAKCEELHRPTGGVHIARTVARLRRGWIGTYVTTSYFSRRVQREVSHDEFPIFLIGGAEMATQLRQLVADLGVSSLDELLDLVDGDYPKMVRRAQPASILANDFTSARPAIGDEGGPLA